MRIQLINQASLLLFLACSLQTFSQNTYITGTVRNADTKEAVPAASVQVKGGTTGTFTDGAGIFKLSIQTKLPVTLTISSIGYDPQDIIVQDQAGTIDVAMIPASSLGAEVIVSANRVPQKILESPVSIERINSTNIRNTASTSYYDMLKNLKGVDLVFSSLTFATPSTRGFNASGNARLNQLVDGMDNQAPGLNFAVGSVVGVTELDVDNMELLSGASSALYGPGGMNGTLLITSKDPFKYQGLSFEVKEGIMHVDNRQTDGPTAYHDWDLRWGKKVSDRFAFKIGAQFIQAKDWIGTDKTNYQAGDVSQNQYGNVKAGTRQSDPNYDGVNVYGDETTTDLQDPTAPALPAVAAGIKAALQQQLPPSLYQAAANYLDSTVTSYPGFNVSRTGYDEKDVVKNTTVDVKLSGGLYYQFKNGIEASLVGYWGTGNTVYTGSDRYSLKNLKIGQYKLEFKGSNWFVRAYTTQENSGDSYNATITTRLFNEAWKPSSGATGWYSQYAQAFLLSKVQPYITALATSTPFSPTNDMTAHNTARAAADVGRPAPGSEQFNTLFNQVAATPISQGGGLFLDRSDLYLAEGQYNFKDAFHFADLLVGASYKDYVLNSKGTLFADTAGAINISEVGAYAQLSKNLLEDKLSLTASARFDHNENFKGRFTPRFTAVYKVAENHNIRASYQTAYRFPTTQNQWINLVIGGGTVLLGGLPQLRDFYHFSTNKVYTVPSVKAAGIALATGTPPEQALALLKEQQFGEYKPETLRSFELGYKGLINKNILIDAYGYFGRYDNFLGRTIVLQALTPGNPIDLFSGATRRSISIANNSSGKVTTYGFGASIDYLFPHNWLASGSISSDRINDVPAGFVSFFDAPTYRLMLGLGNTGFGFEKRFGFTVNLRNQDGFYYESDFRQGNISGYTTVDAQVSYKFPVQKCLLKVGGTNIFNHYYQTGFGNPTIGGIYYVSVGYNVF